MSEMKISNGAVLKWWNTIQRWKAEEDIHMALSNVDYIEKKIAFASRSVIIRGNDLNKKYFYLDEQNQVKYEGEPGKEEPCLLPGMTKEDFMVERNKLFSEMITIKL